MLLGYRPQTTDYKLAHSLPTAIYGKLDILKLLFSFALRVLFSVLLFVAGPRFVLNPIKIFAGSFGGATLWHNPEYTSPNLVSRRACEMLLLIIIDYETKFELKDWRLNEQRCV